jgi:AcrR family transcriptional regulator
MGRRSGRPRRGDPPLSRERILAAALAIVDSAGVESLTMRRLAAALAVDPMALYRHVPGKSALIDGLVALVFGGTRVAEAPAGDWRAGVLAFAEAYAALAARHPRLVRHLVADREAGADAALLASEPLYAALLGAGLAPADVIAAADLVVDYTHGFLLGAGADSGPGRSLRARLDAHPPGVLPAMRAALGQADEAAIVPDMQAGLAFILDGIAARVRLSQTPSPDS